MAIACRAAAEGWRGVKGRMLLTGQLEAWRDTVGKPHLADGAAAKPPRRGAKVSGARGQPLGRRMVQVVERDQSDMEEVGAARRIAQAAARRSAPEPPAAAWP